MATHHQDLIPDFATLSAKHHLKGETTNCSGHCDKTANLQFSQHSLPLCASA